MNGDFYGFSAPALRGETIALERYRGQVVLVVNTASQCGLTPQYEGLEELYRRHQAEGLVVLGFPCDQFGHQEPGGAETIGQCLINYGVSFPMFAKIEVNGPGAHPLFAWLRRALPGWFGNRVKWNFTKFLIGRDGKPLARFSPATKPARMERAIQKALAS